MLKDETRAEAGRDKVHFWCSRLDKQKEWCLLCQPDKSWNCRYRIFEEPEEY
jgi:hypothetical protein